MSEETAGGRRADEADDARPVTAAGRRRRTDGSGSAVAEPGSRSTGKGAPTPSRSSRSTGPQGSPVARLMRYLREVAAELRKVHWPTRRQLVVYTGVVLAFVTFMVALVWSLDAVFAKAVFALFG